MPQDRVGSFSGFDSKMLLKETEKSISSSQHLYLTHEELIALEKEILDSDTNLHTIEVKAAKLQEEVNRLEREKELMEERELYMKQLHLLKQKLAWVQFEAKRQKAVELKDQRKELKNQLAKARDQIQPIKTEIERIEEDLSRNTARKSSLAKVIHSTLRQYESGFTKSEKFMDEIESCQIHLNEIDTNYRRAQLKVTDCQKRVELQEGVMATFPPESEMVEAHKSAHQEQRAIRDKMSVIKHELTRYQQ